MQAIRALVVEDDAGLRSAVARALAGAELVVDAVGDASAAMEHLERDGADVVVLDIGLPDADGRDLCQAMRARGVLAPVLFLTARGHVSDVLSGYAAGGDDYLAKPFHIDELVARVTALGRRATSSTSAPSATGAAPAVAHLDPGAHALVLGGRQVRLTPTEYRILAALLGAGDRVVRRRELTAAAWPAGAVVSQNTLDQYLTRVRRKLGQVPGAPNVVTVHGVGYRIG